MNNTAYREDLFSAIPFPNLIWWKAFLEADHRTIDIGEYFQRMSYRNRYYIGTANGRLILSIPLKKGRDQKRPMKDMEISYAEDWQKNHWRSIQSAYMRTPYFEFYMDHLEPLYQGRIPLLHEWNLQSIRICLDLMKEQLTYHINEILLPESNGDDWRKMLPRDEYPGMKKVTYIQPFEPRWGFIPNLSILDLLSCAGPDSLAYLKSLPLVPVLSGQDRKVNK